MGSDRARISYDEQRQYRAVIMQQGRVTVEADWNEAWQIANEERRKEILDIVGPCGTPDDGYRIVPAEQVSSPVDPYDFAVTKGTMYVGGLRAYLPQDVLYSDQSNWKDNPLLLHSSPVTYPEQEFIYLSLREQEVSAVEDTVLREVALGGPDTAQRLRLVQRIKRMSTNAQDCATALEEAVQQWASCGYTFVPRDMRLMPSGTLKVGFQNVVTTPNPCDPQSTGGYLGADNQLIRIQISQVDATNNKYRLLWGYDNASSLYQITSVDGSTTTFKLTPLPIDDLHMPRQGQAVEILRSAVKLDADPQDTANYMASATGLVTTVTSYDATSGQVTLQDALSDEFTNTTETPMLFLRAWEEELSFTLGTAVDLGNANSNSVTGLQVTIRVDKGEILGVGTYWQIAVRPSTPTEVYPHRYLESPQPPDGPRIWVCPLGVIQWVYGQLEILADCRNYFDNLVTLTKRNLGGCCNVTLRPEDITKSNSLQSILDKYSNQEKITVCLTPGTYTLPQPLQLGPEHSNLTLECCHKGAIIQAAAGSEDQFLDGLIVLNGASNVTFQGLHFALPLVPFFNKDQGDRSRIAGLNATELEQIVDLRFLDLQVSIGIRPLDCSALTIKDCYFEFPSSLGQNLFGAGIFAGGTCQGIAVQSNQFVGPADTLQVTKIPFSFLFGYLLTPTTQWNQGVNNNSITVEAIKARRVSVLLSTLQDALFQDNLFTGLSSAVFIYANAGIVKFERNTVQECYAGFWLLSLSSLAYIVSLIGHAGVSTNPIIETARDPLAQIGSVIAQGYPLPKGFDISQAIQVAAPPIVTKATTTATAENTPIQTLLNKAFLSSIPESTMSTNSISTSETDMGSPNELYILLAFAELMALRQRTQPSRLHLALHLSDNDISALVSVLPPYTVQNVLSSTALVVWDWDIKQEPDKTVKESDIAGAVVVLDTTSTMIMSANKIRNQSKTMLTAFVLMIDYCVITGNLVLNEERNVDELYYPSLILVPASSSQGMRYPGIAITGNVFQGAPSLPDRSNIQSPMNTWDFLNTIIP